MQTLNKKFKDIVYGDVEVSGENQESDPVRTYFPPCFIVTGYFDHVHVLYTLGLVSGDHEKRRFPDVSPCKCC